MVVKLLKSVPLAQERFELINSLEMFGSESIEEFTKLDILRRVISVDNIELKKNLYVDKSIKENSSSFIEHLTLQDSGSVFIGQLDAVKGDVGSKTTST